MQKIARQTAYLRSENAKKGDSIRPQLKTGWGGPKMGSPAADGSRCLSGLHYLVRPVTSCKHQAKHERHFKNMAYYLCYNKVELPHCFYLVKALSLKVESFNSRRGTDV
jgi:hypothetical protein